MSIRFYVSTLLAICLALTACEQQKAPIQLHQKVETAQPVGLPAKPDFYAANAKFQPDKNGVWTTDGLIFNQKEMRNSDKPVRVKGIVSSVSPDCPEVTKPYHTKGHKKAPYTKDEIAAAKKTKRCRTLNVTIKSNERGMEMRVTGYHPFYHPHLKPGTELDITGKYVSFSPSGLVEWRSGLIIVDEFHNVGVDNNGNFTNKRSEISNMIAKGELVGMKN